MKSNTKAVITFRKNLILAILVVSLLINMPLTNSLWSVYAMGSEVANSSSNIDAINEQALVKEVKNRVADVFGISEDEYSISDIHFDQEWAQGIIAQYALEEGTPSLYLFIAYYEDNLWEVQVETEPIFYEWLDRVPETLISAEAKSYLDPRNAEKQALPSDAGIGDGSAMLSLPWATGETWKLTGGTHNNSGLEQRPWSAIDFQGPNRTGKVRAAANGTIYRSSNCKNFIRIDHANGWQTGYYHLTNEQVSNGQTVQRGQYIGDISIEAGCGGSATGPHVHFSLRKSNAYQDLNNKDIGGWTIKDGTSQYTGCMTRVKDNSKICQWGYIYNDGSIGSGNSLAAPNDVSATDGDYEDRTEVTWTYVSGATYYEIWRHTSNNIGYATLIASNAVSPHNDTGGSLGKAYYYWVKACNVNGCSNFSTPNTGFRQTPGVVLLYAPALTPSTITCDNYWMAVSGIGYQGTNAYLTVNTNTSNQSTNSGIWQPSLPVDGKYKVEAYIGNTYNTTCSGTISGGYTGDAKYVVYHANGVTTVPKNQKNSINDWLDIGTFSFNSGTNGKVKLSDLNGEANFSRVIFFNAMKFTLIETAPPIAFDKIGPVNTSIQVENPVTLTWTTSNTAIDYDYCIDTTNDNSCDQWISSGSSTSVIVDNLLPNTTYYWQVKSENTGGITYANNDSTNYWSFTTQPIQGDDNYEENDTLTTAYDLTDWKQTWLSTLNGYGKQIDDDWYRIGVLEGYQHIIIDVRFTHSQGDIDISLYDLNGSFLTDSHGITDNEYIDYLVPYAGVYYIKVHYANQGNQYDLRWDNLYTSPTFQDVPTSYWSWQFIERLYNAGVTGGCSTSPMMYCPANTVTRDQMAVFLLRGEHGSTYTPPAATGSMFVDVPSTHWAAAWIEQLANEGITGGCGNGNYCPSTPVTRDQMAVFLLRGEHGGSYVPPEATGAMFADVPSTHWAAAWIEQLANEGITGGCGGGNYCPSVIVTRDQMAVFLVRAFNLP